MRAEHRLKGGISRPASLAPPMPPSRSSAVYSAGASIAGMGKLYDHNRSGV